MQKRWIYAAVVPAAVMLAAPAAVAKDLTVAISTEPWDLDPAIRTDTGSGYVIANVYDPLIEIDTSNQPSSKYAVAKSWEWQNKNRTLVFQLREGIKFHDGSDLTAADVKYNIEWQLDDANNAPQKGLVGPVETVTVVDDHTLKVDFTDPYPDALQNWARALDGIVPEGGHGERTDEKGTGGFAGTQLSRQPVGSGPYKFERWVSGSRIVLSKNPDYWADDVALADQVTFEFIGDEAAKLAALISGSVDIVDKVPYRDYETVNRMPNVATKRVPGIQTQILYINLGAPPLGIGPDQVGDQKAVERAYHARKFLFHAVDREEIADELFYGMASIQAGPWYRDSEWTSPKLKKMTLHDPELAREHLQKAGFGDGGLSFQIMATNAQWFVDLATMIQEQLRQYDVEVEVVPLDKSAFFDSMYESNDWNAGQEDWGLNNFSALSWLYSGYYRNNHNHNNWHHESPDLRDIYHPTVPGHKEFVELYDSAVVEPNEGERKQLVYEMQEMVTEQVIQLDLMFLDNLYAWQTQVEGYGEGLNSGGDINLRFIDSL